MKQIDIIDAVTALNDKLFIEGYEDGNIQFLFSTIGYIDLVEFLGVVIWNSEDDCRDWNDDTVQYEPILDCLQRQANELISKLSGLEFI